MGSPKRFIPNVVRRSISGIPPKDERQGETENYPDLKANQNFLELQAQLEGTENRINVARTNFNNAAKNFNTAIRRFPKNILAGLFGFEKRAYFEAAEGAEQAPQVQF